jgi:hypothetical protein
VELFIYIQSPIFNTAFAESNLFIANKKKFIALDAIDNGLVLENISNETIEALIAEHTKEVEPENYSEELLPFNGGVYLQAEGKIIDSNCCGDISNVDNWREILLATNTHWQTMWIGHPEIAYKMDDENIYFSNDLDEKESGELTVKFVFNKLQFLNTLENKLKLFDDFKKQTIAIIEKSNILHRQDLIKVLF